MHASSSRKKPRRSSKRSRTIDMPKVQVRPHGEKPTKSASRTMAPSSGPSFETPPSAAPQDEIRKVAHRAATDHCRRVGVDPRPYKDDETALYKTIPRQVMFSDADMPAELR